MAKKNVVTGIIQDDEFMGCEFFEKEDWEKLVVQDFVNLGPKFVKDFKDGPAALVAADVAEDGSTFEKLWLITTGKVFSTREKTWQTGKLWNFKENVLLKVEPLNLEKFDFTRGYMFSEPLDGSKVEHSFVNEDGDKVPLIDLAAQGYDGFTLRCAVVPITTASAKLFMFIYPCNKVKLAAEHEWSARMEFPATLLTSVMMDLGVQQSRVTKKSTGCPVLPVIRLKSPLDQKVPAMGEVGYKTAILFNRLILPEVKTTMKSLWERMGAIKADGASQLKGSPPEKIWPNASDLPNATGENL